MTNDEPEGEKAGKHSQLKSRGKQALAKAKDSMDTLYGKKLTDRVEEYAQLSYHVMAAHEDRIKVLDEALKALEEKTATGVQVDSPEASPSTPSIGWRMAILAALALGLASVVIQMV